MKKYLSFMLIALIALASFVSCEAEPEHVHDWKSVAGKEATCTEAGYKAYDVCDCGEKKGYEDIPALGHSEEKEEKIIKEATCTAKGEKELHCTRCEYFEKEEIPMKDHEFTVDVLAKAHTCTEDGYSAHKKCANCTETEGLVVDPAGHDLEDKEGLAATCTEDGYTAHKACTNCEYTDKVVIPAGHDLEDKEGLAATCTEDGYTAYKACKNCEYTEGKEPIKAGHDFSKDCEKGGSHKICEVCSTSDGLYVAKQSDWTITEGKATLTPSCDCEITGAAIGSVGPSGGMIFYDCDADNAAEENDGLVSSECGWRYLESAPTLLKTKKVDEKDTFLIGEDADATVLQAATFGYYMKGTVLGGDNKPTTVGTATVVGTSQDLGKGKANTEALVAVKDVTMTGMTAKSSKSSIFTANLCTNLEYTSNGVVFDDWFLPSSYEMEAYFVNIVLGKGYTDIVKSYGESNVYYTTSSEASATKYYRYAVTSSDHKPNTTIDRKKYSSNYYTLPVRSF